MAEQPLTSRLNCECSQRLGNACGPKPEAQILTRNCNDQSVPRSGPLVQFLLVCRLHRADGPLGGWH